MTDGVPSVILIRGYIDLAVEEGHVRLSGQELAELVTRDSMIGVTEARTPEPALPR